MILPLLCLVFLILGFLVAWFNRSLRGFSRSRLSDLCEARGKGGRFAQILKERPRALLFGDTMLLALTAALCGCFFAWRGSQLGDLTDVTTWIEILGVVALGLLFLVALPWSLGRVTGERYLVWMWPGWRTIQSAFAGYVAIVGRLDTVIHRLGGKETPNDENGEEAVLSELKTVVDEGEREGVIESEAKKMITKVIDLQNRDVDQIMTPRTDMVTVSADASLEEARGILLEAGHSRVPVIGDSPDDVHGILYAKDLLNYLGNHDTNGQPQPGLSKIAREPEFVPDTLSVEKLMEKMRDEKNHMAIVLDEYGGVSGVVTMEDILEDIVGDIVDEYDPPEEHEDIRELSAGVLEVDARTDLDDLSEKLNIELPDGDYETVAGFVIKQLGKVPLPGESCTWNQYRFTVTAGDKRRIETIKIEEDPKLAQALVEAE